MRAAIYDQIGASADVLRVEDVERPEPGPGQVRVRIELSGVNPTDWKSRSGLTSRPVDGFQVPHHDGVGVIDAVGDGVDQGRVGQRVWTWLAAAGNKWGTAAQWSVVPGRQAVALPDGVSDDLAVCLGVPAMTAHRVLFADGPVTGKTVLVAGGAGAVGHFAIELAKHAGARVVTTVSGPEKAELAAKAGADLVVNYREPGAAEKIKEFGPVDRIAEVDLHSNLDLDLAVLSPNSQVITYASTAHDPVVSVRACMNANVALRFVLLYGVPAEALDQGAVDITTALRDGALSGLPLHRYDLDAVVAAQDAVQAGAVGKVVVVPG
ncbi:MAG TPA: NADPH:quinone reductase [Streptosporangiaceae bacterium]|nr:NADPH:quinone reductase [Streptosporangiaceae bacterium]